MYGTWIEIKMTNDEVQNLAEFCMLLLAGPKKGYQKTSADLTVDYFLKSLANHKIDLKSLDRLEPDRDTVFRSCRGNQDGTFKISDIHENGYTFGNDDYEDLSSLKRCHSTGDLCAGRTRKGPLTRMNGADEPRYHLDSDHSSQHDEKPEDLVRSFTFHINKIETVLVAAASASGGRVLPGAELDGGHHHIRLD
ncbi:hypothetical protein YQE_04065, partial [Dendroctonus ponderosae]